MNIRLTAYYDRNFGDDMMVRLAAAALGEHRLFLEQGREEFLVPFRGLDNVCFPSERKNAIYDGELRVTGSYFMVRREEHIRYIRDRGLDERREKRRLRFKCILGCSAGPFVSLRAERAARFDIGNYDLITVRDRYSYDLIKKYNKRAFVHCFPDIVFSLPDDWIPAPTGEGLLGMVVHNDIIAPRDNGAFARRMAQVCDKYIEKHGRPVLLFVFDIGVELDILCACNIKAWSKYPDMLEIVLHEDNGDHVLRQMARCGTVVSARLHGVILALRMGIPVLPVLYTDKTQHVLDDLGFTGKRYTVEEFVAASVESIYEETAGAARFVLPAGISAEADRHFEVFRSYLEELESK